MKHSVLILAFALSVSLMTSCKFFSVSDSGNIKFYSGDSVTASGTVESRKIAVADFNAIDVGSSCKVTYVPGECGLEIRTHDNLFDRIETIVENGVLKIRTNFSHVRKVDTLEIFVQSPYLNSVCASGAVEFNAENGLTAQDDFGLEVSGAGDVSIRKLKADDVDVSMSGAAKLDFAEIDCRYLKFDISGAGDGNVTGKAASADVSISGAGKIDLSDLECEDVGIFTSGAGKVIGPKE